MHDFRKSNIHLVSSRGYTYTSIVKKNVIKLHTKQKDNLWETIF